METKTNKDRQVRALIAVLMLSVIFNSVATVRSLEGSLQTEVRGISKYVSNPIEVGPSNLVIISNPYEGVDWNTFSQFKTALHVHTFHSDGINSMYEMIMRHYNLGFHVIAITDHDVLTYRWDEAPIDTWGGRLELVSTNLKDMIYAGDIERLYSNTPYGMISIPHSNERSRCGHHHVTLWANSINNWNNLEESFKELDGISGVWFLAHPGRYTGGMVGGIEGVERSKDSNIVEEYVRWMLNHESLLGIEIHNRLDNETRSDRILWDQILMKTMPKGRNVFGFSNDDSHSLAGVGFNWNVVLAPILHESYLRYAITSGAFYAVTRFDRQLGINYFEQGLRVGDLERILQQNTPSLTRVEVGNDIIIIKAQNYERIEWVADGQVIHVGAYLDIREKLEVIDSYVRVQIISSTGVAMLQPFGILPKI